MLNYEEWKQKIKVVRLQVDRIINSTDPSCIDNQIETTYPSTTQKGLRNDSSIRQKMKSYAWNNISASCTLKQIYLLRHASICSHVVLIRTLRWPLAFSHILCPPRSSTQQAPYRKKTGLLVVDVIDWVLPAFWDICDAAVFKQIQ